MAVRIFFLPIQFFHIKKDFFCQIRIRDSGNQGPAGKILKKKEENA